MDRRFTITQWLAALTATAIVMGLIRAAIHAAPSISGFFTLLAIWVALSVIGLWGLGAWPWNQPIGR